MRIPAMFALFTRCLTAAFLISLSAVGSGQNTTRATEAKPPANSQVKPPANSAAKPTEKGTPAGDLTSGPPAKDKPTVPGWGFYPQFPKAWLATHQGFVERAQNLQLKGDIDALFIGDSITQGWGGDGKAIWDKRYAPYKAVNFGMGGDSTRQVLWRILHGEVEGLHPKLIVLMIGTNNLYDDYNAGTDEEIANGIGLIVNELRQKMPMSRVLLLGLLPRQNDYFCGRVVAINLLLSRQNGRNPAVRFLDMGDKFLSAPGKVKPELYNADQLHLNAAGYQVWADAMQPNFNTMMGIAK